MEDDSPMYDACKIVRAEFSCVCDYNFCLACKASEEHDGGTFQCITCNKDICNSFTSTRIGECWMCYCRTKLKIIEDLSKSLQTKIGAVE